MTTSSVHVDLGDVRVHVLQTGRLAGNRTFLRAEGWGALLRRRRPFEFPVHAFVLEHPEGLIAVDTGMVTGVRVPRSQRRFVPTPIVEPGDELGPQLRLRGLDPADVRRVVVTHLDWDHVGGVRHVPRAEVLVHRPEHAAAATRLGRMRYQPGLWPARFAPSLYDLDPEPLGPFPRSRAVTARGDVRVVPLPGHSAGQVGVVLEAGGHVVLFAADHVLRLDWFLEDYAAGRLLGLGLFFPDLAVETSRRVHRLIRDRDAVLLPAHDDGVPARLGALAATPRAAAG